MNKNGRALAAAEWQRLVIAAMVASRPREFTSPKYRRLSDAALWRELFVLLGLCGCGWE